MLVVDTNILLHAANSDSLFHTRAVEVLTDACTKEFGITLAIGYEFLRVATHARVFHRPLTAADASRFLRSVVDRENCFVLLPTQDHFSVLSEVLSSVTAPAGNLFHDIATVVLMIENGVKRIVTADSDLLRFPQIEVLNPF